METAVNSAGVQNITLLKGLAEFVKEVHVCRGSLIGDEELGDGSFFGFDERSSGEENDFELKIFLRSSDINDFVMVCPSAVDE